MVIVVTSHDIIIQNFVVNLESNKFLNSSVAFCSLNNLL